MNRQTPLPMPQRHPVAHYCATGTERSRTAHRPTKRRPRRNHSIRRAEESLPRKNLQAGRSRRRWLWRTREEPRASVRADADQMDAAHCKRANLSETQSVKATWGNQPKGYGAAITPASWTQEQAAPNRWGERSAGTKPGRHTRRTKPPGPSRANPAAELATPKRGRRQPSVKAKRAEALPANTGHRSKKARLGI